MALIAEFHELAESGTERVHGSVDCGFKVFDVDGRTYVQLDTYGSTDRKLDGKVSQTMQLDETGAAYLAGVLTRAFPNIRR